MGRRYALRATAIAYVVVLVVAPVIAVFWHTVEQGWGTFVDSMTTPDAVHAFRLTVEVATWAVVLNTLFGTLFAVLLVRYRFVGKRVLSVLIDLPVSVSPIVVGLALVLVYGPRQGWFGPSLTDVGVQIVYSTPGMVLATAFVSVPLVVREIVPVLAEAGIEQDQAAQSLGANAVQRFWRITLPTIKWAIAFGVVLSTARSLGEFGAVKVVSGNVSGQTETATLLIEHRAELFEPGAYQASVVLILVSVAAIVAISLLRPQGHTDAARTRRAASKESS